MKCCFPGEKERIMMTTGNIVTIFLIMSRRKI